MQPAFALSVLGRVWRRRQSDGVGRGCRRRGGSGGGGGRRSSNAPSLSDDGSRGPQRDPLWFVKAYMDLLETRALETKMVSAFVLGVFGDAVAQWAEQRNKLQRDWSTARLAALGLVGALYTAPMFHFFYEWLELTIPTTIGKRAVSAQVALDQLVAAPLFLMGFFPVLAVLEGRPLVSWRKQVWDSLKLAWLIFPPFQLVSFAFLPAKTRVLVINVLDLGYNVALSLFAHRDGE